MAIDGAREFMFWHQGYFHQASSLYDGGIELIPASGKDLESYCVH